MAQTLDNQGNVMMNGYSTNLNPTQYASQNTNTSVSLPTTISASSLGTPQSSLNVTQPNYNINQYQNTANSSQAYISSARDDEQRIVEQNAQLERDAITNANSEIGRLSGSLQGKNSDTYTANRQTGATDKLAILNRLNAESLGLGYAKETIPLQLQNQATGQGVTDRGLAPIETAQLRNNAIQLASNAYQSAIARNDYETAKVKADELVANKYDGILAEIEAKKINLDNLKSNLTSAEKKVAEATTARLLKEQRSYEEKKASDKSISDLVINSAQEGAPQELRDRAAKAKTPLEAANILGPYAGEYRKGLLLEAQIKKTVADAKETDAKARAINEKSDGTNIAGKPMKVSNGEITNLNEAITARDSVVSLVNQFKQNIKDNGTQVLFGEAAGTRDALKTSLLLALKTMEKTGALDAGTISVLQGIIPDNKFFATQAAQTAALDSLVNTVSSKTDSYVGSYKGTSAEADPRTKRAYAEAPIVSSGNKQADDYAKLTMKARNSVNQSLSTPSGTNAGYQDNQ